MNFLIQNRQNLTQMIVCVIIFQVGEAFLTLITVSLPSLFGLLKSDSHRNLSKRRRVERILGWLSQITTVRRVDMRRMSSPKSKKTSENNSPTPTTPNINITNEQSPLVVYEGDYENILVETGFVFCEKSNFLCKLHCKKKYQNMLSALNVVGKHYTFISF